MQAVYVTYNNYYASYMSKTATIKAQLQTPLKSTMPCFRISLNNTLNLVTRQSTYHPDR